MLSWTKLNPTVKIIGTKKKFFNTYLFKSVIYCPGGRVLSNSSSKNKTVKEMVQERIDTLNAQTQLKSIWFASYSKMKADELVNHCSIDQLEYFLNIKKTNPGIKIRIEEPNISVYAKDEAELFQISSVIKPDRVKELHRPSSVEAAEALERGEIIVKKPTDYNYKICLKECILSDVSIKQQIYDYLYALGDEVSLTKSLKKHLGSKLSYFCGGYFYCKDSKIITFIHLICPSLIAGIYKVTKLDS